MNNSLKKAVKSTEVLLTKHSPEILTGLGIVGMFSMTVTAVRATPKALILIQKEKETQNTDKLSWQKKVKASYKCYLPSAAIGIVSTACLVGASSINLRRNAALTTAYMLTEATLKDYRNKVVETIGEKKEQAVRDAVAKEKIEKKPLKNQTVVLTGKGETLCYDAISDRYFKSDIETLKQAANAMSRRLLVDTYVSLNDFYWEIGLKTIKIGDSIGWNVDDGLIEPTFSAQLADDGSPCLVLDYDIAPRYDYMRR